MEFMMRRPDYRGIYYKLSNNCLVVMGREKYRMDSKEGRGQWCMLLIGCEWAQHGKDGFGWKCDLSLIDGYGELCSTQLCTINTAKERTDAQEEGCVRPPNVRSFMLHLKNCPMFINLFNIIAISDRTYMYMRSYNAILIIRIEMRCLG